MRNSDNISQILTELSNDHDVPDEIMAGLIKWSGYNNAKLKDVPGLSKYLLNYAELSTGCLILKLIDAVRSKKHLAELEELEELSSLLGYVRTKKPQIRIPESYFLTKAEEIMRSYKILNEDNHYIRNRGAQNKKILVGLYSLFIKHKFLIVVGQDIVKLNERRIIRFLNKRYKINDLQEFSRIREECEALALKSLPAIDSLIREKTKQIINYELYPGN